MTPKAQARARLGVQLSCKFIHQQERLQLLLVSSSILCAGFGWHQGFRTVAADSCGELFRGKRSRQQDPKV